MFRPRARGKESRLCVTVTNKIWNRLTQFRHLDKKKKKHTAYLFPLSHGDSLRVRVHGSPPPREAPGIGSGCGGGSRFLPPLAIAAIRSPLRTPGSRHRPRRVGGVRIGVPAVDGPSSGDAADDHARLQQHVQLLRGSVHAGGRDPNCQQ